MTTNPGIYHHQVGEVLVTAVNDGTLELPIAAMLDISAEDATALLTGQFLNAPARPAVNTYLVRGHGRTVLVDTGGGGMAPTLGRLLPNLHAAGVAPEAIDLVVITHLHGDHSGGLATPDGRAVFPRAELGLPAEEAAFWLDPAQEAAAPEARRASFAGARTAVAPYADRTRLLHPGEVSPGLTLVPLPGHTPGHSGYRVGDGAESLLIWGDVVHVPAVQLARPEVSMVFDTDPALAQDSRRRVLDQVVAAGSLVAGMHLDFPGLARIRRAGAGYAMVPERWSPEA